MVRLRRARAEDAGAIRDLTRAAYADWASLIGREPKPMTVDYAAAMLLHRFDLLHAEETLAGLIETVEEGDDLLIENVAVAPVFQGRGLGRRLLAEAEVRAASSGLARLRLYTNARFTKNISLYERLGYAIDRTEDVGVGIVVHRSKAPRRDQAAERRRAEPVG